jgi:hypothetical protein
VIIIEIEITVGGRRRRMMMAEIGGSQDVCDADRRRNAERYTLFVQCGQLLVGM